MIEHNIIKNKKNNLIIEGQRIFLREINLLDANRNYCFWMNDAKANQYLESRFEKWTIKKLRSYINKVKQNPDYLFLAIVTKDKNRHIGNIKIGPINRIHKFADVGILIGERSFCGKGFGSEAIILAKDYAFGNLKLHKLTAVIYTENLGSIKAFRKAGFQQEGLLKKYYFFKDKFIDTIILGILNKKYFQNNLNFHD